MSKQKGGGMGQDREMAGKGLTSLRRWPVNLDTISLK